MAFKYTDILGNIISTTANASQVDATEKAVTSVAKALIRAVDLKPEVHQAFFALVRNSLAEQGFIFVRPDTLKGIYETRVTQCAVLVKVPEEAKPGQAQLFTMCCEDDVDKHVGTDKGLQR